MSAHRVRHADITWREVDDEIVVLDLASSRYLALNGSGALLWRTLVDGAEAEVLTEVLAGEFDISAQQAAHDVDAFLTQCHEMGIVEIGPVGS